MGNENLRHVSNGMFVVSSGDNFPSEVSGVVSGRFFTSTSKSFDSKSWIERQLPTAQVFFIVYSLGIVLHRLSQ